MNQEAILAATAQIVAASIQSRNSLFSVQEMIDSTYRGLIKTIKEVEEEERCAYFKGIEKEIQKYPKENWVVRMVANGKVPVSIEQANEFINSVLEKAE